jgi:hypothetical protein
LEGVKGVKSVKFTDPREGGDGMVYVPSIQSGVDPPHSKGVVVFIVRPAEGRARYAVVRTLLSGVMRNSLPSEVLINHGHLRRLTKGWLVAVESARRERDEEKSYAKSWQKVFACRSGKIMGASFS